MTHRFVFGDNLVAHTSGMIGGLPAIAMLQVNEAGELASAKDLIEDDGTVVIQFRNPAGAWSVIQMVFNAVIASAIAAGTDPEQLRMPIIPISEHNQIVADLNRRNDDLLEANNRYLQRARDAEIALALLQKDQPVKVGA